MIKINEIYCSDNIDILNNIDDNSIDLILTDPPYNASNSKFNFKQKNYNAIDEEWDKGFKIDFFDICVDKLKEGSSMLIFCSYHLLGEYLAKKSIKLQQIIHWIKRNPVPSFTKTYAPGVEYCLWYVKPGKAYTFNKECRFSYKNIFETNINGWKVTDHPTEKNLSIIKALIETHSNKGDLVLDPFMGSGTTIVGCIQTGRSYIGIDKDMNYYQMADKRRKESYQLSLLEKNYD